MSFISRMLQCLKSWFLNTAKNRWKSISADIYKHRIILALRILRRPRSPNLLPPPSRGKLQDFDINTEVLGNMGLGYTSFGQGLNLFGPLHTVHRSACNFCVFPVAPRFGSFEMHFSLSIFRRLEVCSYRKSM